MATTSEIVADIVRVARELGVSSLSRSRYLQLAHFSGNQIYDGGRTWTELCTAAGLSTGANNNPVRDEEYFRRLAVAINKLGRYPRVTERKLFGLNVSKARYRNYSEFIRAAVSQGKVADLTGEFSSKPNNQKLTKVTPPIVKIGNTEKPRVIPPIPRLSKRKKWERTDIDGFPYAPQDESGVVALFAVLCSQGAIRWQIIDLNGSKGIDCICYDEDAGKEIHVEIKYILSRSGWNHPIEEVDYVVCWESHWNDFPKPVYELRKLVELT